MLPKIMEPRLITSSIESQYAGLPPQPLELMVRMIVSDRHSYLCGQKGRGPLVPEARPMSHSVKSQDADKIFPNRNQSGLAELRFPNGQCRLPEIHIFMLQASRLTQAQPCSVEHDDQRAHGVWGQGACWRVVRIRNSQQPTDIFS
jgi:hypothetical protein